MAKRKTYRIPERKQEAFEIEITGTRFSNGEPFSEVFTVVPSAPAGTLTDLISAPDRGDSAVAGSLTEYLESVIVEADVERFRKTIRSPEYLIEIELLGQIVNDIVEEHAARPTKRPTASEPGPQKTPDTSTDDLDSQV